MCVLCCTLGLWDSGTLGCLARVGGLEMQISVLCEMRGGCGCWLYRYISDDVSDHSMLGCWLLAAGV